MLNLMMGPTSMDFWIIKLLLSRMGWKLHSRQHQLCFWCHCYVGWIPSLNQPNTPHVVQVFRQGCFAINEPLFHPFIYMPQVRCQSHNCQNPHSFVDLIYGTGYGNVWQLDMDVSTPTLFLILRWEHISYKHLPYRERYEVLLTIWGRDNIHGSPYTKINPLAPLRPTKLTLLSLTRIWIYSLIKCEEKNVI